MGTIDKPSSQSRLVVQVHTRDRRSGVIVAGDMTILSINAAVGVPAFVPVVRTSCPAWSQSFQRVRLFCCSEHAEASFAQQCINMQVVAALSMQQSVCAVLASVVPCSI